MSFRNWLYADVATATVATSATHSSTKEPTVASIATVAVANPSESVFNLYHREWQKAWKAERVFLSEYPALRLIPGGLIDDALSTAVSIWNDRTSDFKNVAELRSYLTDDDLTDRELITPAGLALYCWTLWADGRQ